MSLGSEHRTAAFAALHTMRWMWSTDVGCLPHPADHYYLAGKLPSHTLCPPLSQSGVSKISLSLSPRRGGQVGLTTRRVWSRCDCSGWLRCRYISHRSIPEIHQALRDRGIRIAERTVTHLLQRYEELVALHLAEKPRLRKRFKEQGQIVLAIDGLQPDVGHEVLWVLRDCLVFRSTPRSEPVECLRSRSRESALRGATGG
jgi:hypothetical protein